MVKIINRVKENKNFWHLVGENDLFEMVEKSGFGEEEFELFQKQRLRASILSMIAAVVPAILVSPWLAFSSILFFVYTWRSYYEKEKREYQGAVYEKQITWFVFQRLVVTYLQGERDSIFIALNKILERLVDGEFKNNLHRLVIDITEQSDDVEPFIEFANRAAGGTDDALTFMTALYNFKNHSHDSSILDELSELARNAMMRGIHDIREMKEKSFYLFPTKLTMLNVIPMVGYMIGVAYSVFANNMNF